MLKYLVSPAVPSGRPPQPARGYAKWRCIVMRAIWSGSISFGLVNIPVKLYSGSESNSLDLDMLRKKDLCPIKYLRVCKTDGKEVPYEEIVKGYEYSDGEYIVLTDKDFENASLEKTHLIDILDDQKKQWRTDTAMPNLRQAVAAARPAPFPTIGAT